MGTADAEMYADVAGLSDATSEQWSQSLVNPVFGIASVLVNAGKDRFSIMGRQLFY
ncbi:hypothetical protein [Paraburkholderia phytofirmans]|nr:hypothetical protein [Paraburkholderia phytofirmans]